MRKTVLRLSLVLGLALLLSLATHAGPPAPQRAMQYPWLITGHFTYVEYTKSDKEGVSIEDTNQLILHFMDLALVQHDPFDYVAIYALDKADFNAKGEGTQVTVSAGRRYNTSYKRFGGGPLDPPPESPWGPADNPATLTWRIKENRFSLHFQAPMAKGEVTMETWIDDGKRSSITSEYMWACDIDGVVDYNAKTKTYRFVFLDTTTVPYREDSDLRSTVHVQGELTAPLK